MTGGTSTVAVTTSTGQTVTSTPGTNTKVVDESGNVVAISKNGTATQGKYDKNAFGQGATSSEVAQAATDDKLPKVTLTLDTSKPYYGYDTSAGGEPWVSIQTGKSVSLTASVDLRQSSHKATDIRYRTNDGMVVDATGSNPATLTAKGLYSGTAIPILAVADTGKVDSLKTAFVCGKINTVGYDPEYRRVWLVPVNGAKVDKEAIAKKLSAVYRQAVVEWDVQCDPKTMSLTLTDEELKGICKDITVGIASNYTLEQQAVLKKFGREPEERSYILFMVDGKAGDATGFMPLNRSAGFIYLQGQSTDAVARTVAHELGHGAFGLAHEGRAKDNILAATDNLMDYSGGTALTKAQWDAIHSEYRRLKWFQDKEEGMKIESNKFIDKYNIGIAPDHSVILSSKSLKPNCIVAQNITAGSNYVQGFSLFDKGNNEVESYKWNEAKKGYYSGEKSLANSESILVTFNTNKNPVDATVYRFVEGSCFYQYTTIRYKAGDVIPSISEKAWRSTLFFNANPNCLKDYANGVLKRDRDVCSATEIKEDANKLRVSMDKEVSDLVGVVNASCLDAIRSLTYKEQTDLLTKIAQQDKIESLSELAILRIMNTLKQDRWKDFYNFLEDTDAGGKKLIMHLVDEMHDESLYFWDEVKKGENYTNFIGALAYMFKTNPSSFKDRMPKEVEDVLKITVRQKPTYTVDGMGAAGVNLSERYISSECDSQTGNTTLYDVHKTIDIDVLNDSKRSSIRSDEVSRVSINTLSPLDPVVVITDEKQLPMVETALGNAVKFEDNSCLVPAIFLNFQANKERNEQLKNTALVTLDVVTLVTSGGTLTLATQVGRVKQLWALAEMAGALGSIATTTGAVDTSTVLGKSITYYNGIMALIGVKNLGQGISSFAKGLNKTVKNTLGNPNGLRNLLRDNYANFKSTIAKAKGSGIEIPQTLRNREAALDRIMDGAGSVAKIETLPSIIRQLVTKPSYKSLRTIWSKQGKTTTIIGKWQGELEVLYEELSKTTDLNIYMLSGRFDHPSGFNMLSIENWSNLVDNLAKKGVLDKTKGFDDYIWEAYNRPWLENALQRGDDIVIWSDPTLKINLYKPFKDVPSGPTFFNRELEFIKNNASKYGYDYNKGIELGTFSK